MKFYNPYQFIPLARPHEQNLQCYREIGQGKIPHIRHDRWESETYSGRIIGKLETISPLVVGGRQEQAENAASDTGGTVVPYQGGAAIPANTLRGMIASVAETISQSALRVLSDRDIHNYFVRKSPAEALKKIGLLIKKEHDYFLYPIDGGHYRVSCADDALANKTCYQREDNPLPVTAELKGSNARLVNSGGTKGVLYVRGYHRDMPGKRNEIFIPWDGVLNESACLKVPPEKLAEFERELKRRYGALPEFPHQPKGYKCNRQSDSASLVKSGDLVYYNDKGNEVTDLSYSAIWRKPVGNLYDALQKIDDNLLPWGSWRTHLTPAEALFGMVEAPIMSGDKAKNLASRLRFYDARADGPVQLQAPTRLKILASPKPPSPSMYFSATGGGYIAKKDLDLNKHRPNGRKRYLAHPDKKAGTRQWETQNAHDRLNQKPLCTPIESHTVFWFHIDFENLSCAELGLLRTAIAPGAHFQHQLGLGKPLGMGQVCVSEAGVFLIDRKRRYSAQGLNEERYHTYQGDCSGIPENHFPHEYNTRAKNQALPVSQAYLDQTALAALLKLGNTACYEPHPVCYPLSDTQTKGSEEEGFKWFVDNERSRKPQYLQAINVGYRLTSLDSNTVNPDTKLPPGQS